MAAQSSLYNEERNLLRIRERERRNQEILQERDPYVDNAPLFSEPYKTSKGDELSSRIQSMLGNYEEVKELISAKSHQDLIGIPVKSQGRSVKQPPTNSSMGPPKLSMPLGHRNRPQTAPELSSGANVKNHIQNHSLQNNRTQEQRSGTVSVERSGKQGQDQRSAEQPSSPASVLPLSPLLSPLSPPIEPLSPLHSSQQTDSKSRSNRSNASKSPIVTDPANRDGATTVANLVASSQTFPTYLTSKTHTLPPKPTAYVRPMDGQDQAPNLSPDLKPLQEEYHEESYESHVDFKPNAKDKLSRMEITSDHFETFTNEAHCVEDILKEMTHSWPPPLTGIHTPSTAEPSKYAFPNKENQHVPPVKVNQRHNDNNVSKVFPSPHKGSSMLEDDLQISDSEDSDDNDDNEEEEEITEKPLSSAPSSVVQSHVDSVASAHSSGIETEGSESDSSSDSESDSGSSDSEVPPPPRRSPSPVHDTSSTGIWQLGNFLVKPAPLAENHSTTDNEQESHWESKEHDCLSPPPHESPKTEPQHNVDLWTSQEDIESKPTFPDSPISSETVTPRQTVGIKHPRRPVKASFQEEPKGGLTVESEPAPYRSRDQPSKEKPTVKTKIKTKSNEYKEPNASGAHPNEKKKHKSSHHSSSTTKKCPSTQTDKPQSAPSHLQSHPVPKVHIESKSNHRTNTSHPAVVVREDCHRDKVLLPIGENRLLPAVKSGHKSLALVVKIELSLLSRIPGSSSKKSHSKNKVGSHSSHHKERSEKTHTHSKEHTKRKVDEGEKNGTHKKLKLSDTKPSTAHKESSTKKVPKTSSEDVRKEHQQQKALSPIHHTPKKPEKVAQKRRPNESSTCSQQSTTSTSKSSKRPSMPKERKVEEKNTESSKSNKGSAENNTNPFPVPSLPNGNAKPTRPLLKFEEKLHSPEHYMKEAKKLKHKADAMLDKIGKSLNYLDAAMFFIECGIAMEADVQAPKSAYTMFAETVDLIKFIMKLKNFADSLAPAYEKSFAVLCMRCQSVLYMAMFRYKKDTALKYSRTLGEHFKSSSRAAQAPSPCVARSTGTPSPMSPTPSPASSGGSQPGSIASNSGGQNPSVTIPQMIHQIASSYVNITSYFLYAYDIWEQADILAKKNKDFFADLSAVVCPLALNSSMTELVRYTRQGLHWLRLELSMT
ncbi:AF4/FMR2 family member 1 isoform X2 [Bufo gargarizans]|uniref:AF4/FMR2 family member 1 isoform X2 n=1 Tax=Bufo gargarizans TaxID=30331 RepID=UPI001CF254B5|nr:AF4/FMR2 family member 1 isoform X2 [Bufo gargarizans]